MVGCSEAGKILRLLWLRMSVFPFPFPCLSAYDMSIDAVIGDGNCAGAGWYLYRGSQIPSYTVFPQPDQQTAADVVLFACAHWYSGDWLRTGLIPPFGQVA